MVRRHCFFIMCMIFLLALFVPPAVGADSAAVISSLSGKVEVQRSGLDGMNTARLGDQLFENDIVFTRKGARVSLLSSDGSLMTLSPDSQMKISPIMEKKGGGRVGLISKGLMKGLSGLFSSKKKRETRTIIAGIRKKAEEDKGRVKVLYPRNSMILTSNPSFRWRAEGGKEPFRISLTLKGMKGKLWSIQTGESKIAFPEGQKGLERGQTYFLRVESEKDKTLYEEVFFRVLDEKKAQEIMDFEGKLKDLLKSNPDDGSPAFILAGFYKKQGLFHRALEMIELLEKSNPKERFILEEKQEILAKLGLWEDWKAVDQKLKGMN